MNGRCFYLGACSKGKTDACYLLNAIEMHVGEDDSLKWGLIDSKGRKQQAIFINESLAS